jgi:AcrR family transcriptional regulator
MANERPPRRLPKEARRNQLISSAMGVMAEQGLTDFSLDDVAARADVTRNLVYHYFPGGRRELAVAAVRQAGVELTAEWVTDQTLTLDERIETNIGRIADHAFGPSDAWRVHRRARVADHDELSEIVAGYVNDIVTNVARNQLGTGDPPALGRVALLAGFAYGETVFDEARAHGISREQAIQLLTVTLNSIIHALGAVAAATEPA